MSGFDPDWLKLREPVDHRSRAKNVLAALSARFAARQSMVIVDLGCGTGSNLRGTAEHLPLAQHWHLVDADERLLAAARPRLSEWADQSKEGPGGFHLTKGQREIRVSFIKADLNHDLVFPRLKPDLVTAAALFDLVSEPFARRFTDALALANIAFYTVLSYDGKAAWEPADALDQRMLALFNQHQQTDKGLGPALGPAATDVLAGALKRHGFAILRGSSAWQLGAEDAALTAAVTDGWAGAVSELGQLDPPAVQAWLKRQRQARSCLVGHEDLLALPV